jgi:flagellar hook-associated protein 1 FlgK
MGVGPIMDLGRQGIAASRAGMEVVSRNIANASNPDYSRQEIFFQSPVQGGVQTWTVRSQVDAFIEGRLATENQTQGRLETERSLLAEASAVFGNTDSGVTASIANFFAAVSGLSASPDAAESRANLLYQADALASEFQREAGALQSLSTQIGQQLGTTLDQANQIARNIAKLNISIGAADPTDGATGQLADQRAALVKQLGSLIDINTFEDGHGNVTVFVGGGIPLVESGNSYTLDLAPATGFDPYAGVEVTTPGGTKIDITSRVSGGAVGGLMRVRDQVIRPAMEDLDRVAAALVNQFNQIHAQGVGVDSSTGVDFFAPLTPSVVGAGANTGGANVSATILDPSALTLDDYEVVFTSPGQFDLVDATQGTTVSTGNAYASGMTVDVDGVRLTLADATGGPQAGDRFRVSTVRGQALNMAVAVSDPNQIAAAANAAGLPGDNANALALSAVSTTKLLDGGTLTVGEKAGRIASQVGLEQQSVEQAYQAESYVVEGLQSRRSEVSGVSLDEEAAKLIQYQNVFQASARLIRMSDELLQTIINMVQ